MSTFAGATVLITGGTGSFGQCMTESLLRERVGQVRILANGEPRRVAMEQRFHDPRLRYELADIRYPQELRPDIFAGVDVLIHAAALKHVPYAEEHAWPYIHTNVIGSYNVLEAARVAAIPMVIGLSTDKGASPSTVYGTTKFEMERLFVERGHRCTRYGNIAGSSGSLIPRLMEQRKTGTVQLTDERMTRFFMRQEEAVALVVRCATRTPAGTVLIPRPPSVRVVDVIAAVAPGCRIERIGVRGREKIHESLVSVDEIGDTEEWGIDYILGLSGATGIARPYDSGTNPHFLSVEEIRAALPEEDAVAA